MKCWGCELLRRCGCVIAVAALLLSACSLPLASRRAQVLEPGEIEIAGGASFGVARADGNSFSPAILPAVGSQASMRFGIVPRVDLQLRVIDLLVSEISAGWQLVGDPASNDFAVTLTAGAGPLAGLGYSNAEGVRSDLGVFVPLQVLVDVPIADGALTLGVRSILAGVRHDIGGTISYGSGISPGLTTLWTLPLGEGFFLRPELAGTIPLAADDTVTVLVAIALGYEIAL